MTLQTNFLPPRRKGLLVQGAAALALAGGSAFCFWQTARTNVGGLFLVWLLLALVLLAPVPLLAYRWYALLGASYHLEREGLKIRWGLRQEDIPMPDIEWIRPASDLVSPLPFPWLPTPGGILGGREVEGLGMVEFLSADREHMLLVATPKKVYVISPIEGESFLRTFYRSTELGSISPLPSSSVYPTAWINRAWKTRLVRMLLLAGLFLELVLLIWSALVIPTRAALPLGFSPDGAPKEAGSAVRLLLLPVINGMTYVIDLLTGLYMFRSERFRPVAYVLWGGAVITGFLMLLAVLFITTA